MKIVINDDFGGFGLSKMAIESYASRKGLTLGKWNQTYGYFDDFMDRDIPRNDKDLVEIVESLGNLANGFCASLRIVEIPDGVEWHISEYDGIEHIAENHRTWR
jgi:hypothetical protein